MTTTPPVDSSLLKRCGICNSVVYKDSRNRTSPTDHPHSEGCPMIAEENNGYVSPATVDLTKSTSQPTQATRSLNFYDDLSAREGLFFHAYLYCDGGIEPHHFSVSSTTKDQLPAGLKILNEGLNYTGPGGGCNPPSSIAGVPTQQGTFEVTFECKDSSTPPLVATQTIEIRVFDGIGS